MLDIRRMRVLREVAAQGSFSAAAEALNFTQSAVSQHVAALERESGTTLVDRGSRGVVLTDAGRALVGHADAILARLECAEEELADIAGLRGGRLRLACFQSAGATLVPRAVAAFHERHPAVELSMVEAEPDEACARMKVGEIDLALVYDVEAIPGMLEADLELTHLLDDPYDAILPAGHALAERNRLRLADLASEPWIASTDAAGCRRITERACQDAGFSPRVAFEVDETLAAQALVAAGVGVTLLPRLALTTVHPSVVARRLAKAPVRRIWSARTRGEYQSPAGDAMLQILQDVAEDFRAGQLELAS
ncbi:MAG TPA: LysR family transcriptional regulator [Thermoleophilaceae bacterium]